MRAKFVIKLSQFSNSIADHAHAACQSAQKYQDYQEPPMSYVTQHNQFTISIAGLKAINARVA